jgi:hypothetical protein
MTFRIFQALCIAIAFVGWIIYQLLIRKKRFMEISNDVMAIAFFIAVWLGIYYWLIN